MGEKQCCLWKKCGWEFILFVLLFLPDLIALFLSLEMEESWVMKGEYLFFAFLLWLLPFFVLKTRVAFLFCGVGLFFAPLEIGYFWYIGIPVNPNILRTVLITDWREAAEFIGDTWYLLILHLILCAVYIYGTLRITNRFLFGIRWRKKLLLAYVCFNLALYGILWKGHSSEQGAARWIAAKDSFLEKYYKVYPFSFWYAVQNVLRERVFIYVSAEKLRNFRFGVEKKDSPQRHIVIWVMGESSRYDHYSINGYSRATSPRLMALPGLLSFKQMYSEANMTAISLPLFFTRATPQNPELALKEKSLVDLFSEAGFRTAWIGNQSSENALVSRIAGDADYAYFTVVDYKNDKNYDGILLEKLKEQLKEEGNLFILLHCSGSHFQYEFRYPSSFKRFSPVFEKSISYDDLRREAKEKIVNAYDNTILYTDYVLDSLIRIVKQQHAVSVVVYTSDHGESLFDDANTEGGHSHAEPPVCELHVPLFVWTSEAYNNLYPEKRRQMEQHREAPLNSSNLFYSIADLAALKFPGQKLQKSFASPLFLPDSATYVQTVDERVIRVR